MLVDTAVRLDEVHLSVQDLAKMREFYMGTLGFEEDFYHEGQMLGLRTRGAALVLKASKERSSGISLVFGCADIEHSLKAVTEKGVSVTVPMYEGHWGAKVVGFEDPEGNTIILEQPTEAKTHQH